MEPGPTSGSQLNRLLSGGDASQILKDMLNVGKPNQSNNGGVGSGSGASPQNVSDLSSQANRGDPAVMNAMPSQSAKNLLPDATALADIMPMDKKVLQSIVLEGDDRGGSVPIYGREVDITPSSASCVDSPIPGSNKVKITPVVNYEWEAKYYFGNLVAVNNTFLVYVLRIQSGYGLRILNRRSTVRALLKGFSCIIVDIAFAFHNADILGCVDQRGNLSVWHIKEEGGKITYEPKIQVKRSLQPSDYHRIVWCPYLPDDLSDEELSNEWSNLLAVSHGEKAELWDIAVVASELGTNEILYEQVSNGLIRINGHTKAITDMAVSPDGSVLASASMDGTVRFWQMYWEVPEDPPRCLHQFAPHDGEPVMSLLFCDNHKQQDASLPFWRFLITGADRNRELKVWCTVQWTCLQKIRFGSSPNDIQPCLKVKLDLSASFLMATDIRRKVLYVIQLYQEHEEGRAHFSSVTEFLLMQPMLSFAIVDAGRCRAKQTQEEVEDGEELQPGEFEEVSPGEDGDRVDNGQAVSVLVKMFCVFSRALQELQIRFQPTPSVKQDILAGSINTTTSHGDNTLLDGLSDVSFSATERSLGSTDTEQPRLDTASLPSPHRDPQTPSAETSSFTSESTHSSSQPYLMTPESLMNSSRSPTKTTTPQNLLRDSTTSSSSSFTHITGTNVSVDDLLSSCGTSEMNTLAATPDSSVTLTPTPTASNHVSPLVGKPSPVGGGHMPKTYEQIKEDEDEGPKSPPPSPVGGDIQDLQGDQLLESSENVAELLKKSARIKEKRISDSSAEVAQILGTNVEEEEAEDEELEDDVIEQEGNDEEDNGQSSPVTMDKGKVDVDDGKEENQVVVAQETNTLDEKNTEGILQSSRTDDDDDGSQASAAHGEVRDERGSTQLLGEPVVQQLQNQALRSEDSDLHQSEYRQPQHSIDQGKYQQDIGQIMNNLEQMMSLLQTQQQEIKHLRQEMNKAQLSNSIIQSTKARIDKLEKGLGTKLDTIFTKQSEQERQRLSLALQEKTNLDKQKQERLLETVTQTLKQQVTSRLDKTVRTEIEAKVVPELNRVLVPVTEQLNTSIGQKLTATDQLMKENIQKLVKSKGVADTMGQAAASTLSTTIQNTYREAFHSTVVPAFERACSSMFEQINTSFDAGTREYVNQLEANLAKTKQKQREGQEPIMKELKSMVETQRTSMDELKASIFQNVQGEISEQLHTTTEKLKRDVLDRVQVIVQEEIGTALKAHQATLQQDMMAAIRSQAATPIPQAQDVQHIQAKIKQLIEQKLINAAFQHALNASDLRVVVFTCNEVTPDTIFTDDGCLLEQPVLLSLIQQLSQDLGSQTKIKCTYIDEALLAVDTTFPVTREHLSGIITELCRQITMVLQTQPNHPQTKQLKRVLMQAQSLK
ncbi:enhancer of mRNA-decapping protein 4-like isoform X1 [Lytechinus variegatus]|uniref:enhancer of mRNA-decapping protein 4-like isoform X1 n=1 Tax=Lytechinus variegatus TaxID=7654 RepID=UPI001BB17152|nr:enhancer of mRNA-decapping protein 4-like isoform X1 [Lytechinus variegatus]